MNKSLSCLIVEDSKTQAMALADMLIRNGYEVRIATNGREALALLERFEPTVIVSDIVMPEMDGLELCRALKSDERYKHISVMLLSTLSEPDDVFRALDCGADNFITKPAEEKQILNRLAYLTANQSMRHEETVRAGIEIDIGGSRQFVTSSRIQILNLLISSYDVAVQRGRDLEAATQALREANDTLEAKVAERTAHLELEIERRSRAEGMLYKQARLAALLEAAAAAANQGESSDVATLEVLRTTCLLIRWPLAHFYRVQGESTKEIVPSDIWFNQDESRFLKFVERTNASAFKPGDAIPGEVFEKRRSVWLSDIDKTDAFLRKAEATEAGIRSIVAVPVAIGSKIIGILEFFHTERIELDSELLTALEQASHHLGRMFEREAASKALVARESFLQSILDHSTAVIYVKDLEGRYLTVNRAFEKLVGRPSYEVKRLTDHDVFPAATADVFTQNDQSVARSAAPMEFEEVAGEGAESRTYLSHKYPLFDADGTMFATGGHSTDITERKKAQEYRRLMSEAIDQSTAGIALVTPEGDIALANPSFAGICGCEAGSLRRIEDVNLGHAESEDATIEDLWQKMRLGNKERSVRTFHRFEHGSQRVWSVRVSHVRNAADAVTHYLFILRDVTEQRALERQSQRKHRLESIGTLAGGITHDFNNLLAVIQGYTEFALSNLEDPVRTRSDLENVRSASKRAALLIQQILRFSRSEAGKRERMKVDDVVRDILELAKAAIPSAVVLSSEIDRNAHNVVGDASQLEQVLLNLITNASHALGRSAGHINLKTESCSILAGDEYIHPDLTLGDYVRISVADDGCGMSQSTMDRIFDPFFTTKGADEGTGLGLANAHAIIRDHEGAITVYSEVGVGTEFHVYLPIDKDDAENAPAEEEAVQIQGGNEHIVVVDDEEVLALLNKRLLERNGYTVTVVTNPKDALLHLREYPGVVDLLITDSSMPGITGEKLAEVVLKEMPELPVIIMSGYSGKASIAPLTPNVKGFLAKPLPQAELLNKVREVLGDNSADNA